ncbi:sulfatase-like hydrolase/transferase, partial [Paraburkholderia sp.]|uniref:sulfatase-like hydrolase/transferase n=1 Tax=Paraburkholderia sp. TaxID=1926495 RepID=UPI002D62D4F6
MRMFLRKGRYAAGATVIAFAAFAALILPSINAPAQTQAPAKPAGAPATKAPQQQPAAKNSAKPNILVIFGDDIGQANISAYTRGVVGYKTPNIDRVANEGMIFTDYYAENSCTAGRSSFITGQTPLRTGLSKVGAPGAPVGLQKTDMTIAQALKPLGYATGQFGK